MVYEIWKICCDVPSEWDGGDGECVDVVETQAEADEAVKECQRGGHAAWFNLVS